MDVLSTSLRVSVAPDFGIVAVKAEVSVGDQPGSIVFVSGGVGWTIEADVGAVTDQLHSRKGEISSKVSVILVEREMSRYSHFSAWRAGEVCGAWTQKCTRPSQRGCRRVSEGRKEKELAEVRRDRRVKVVGVDMLVRCFEKEG